MNLPRYNGKQLHYKNSYCAYEDPDTKIKCNAEYYGASMQKYCEHHKNPLNRKRYRKNLTGQASHNITVVDLKRGQDDIRLKCTAIGCRTEYKVHVTGRTNVWPRYCEEHRNAYKRWMFERRYLRETAGVRENQGGI